MQHYGLARYTLLRRGCRYTSGGLGGILGVPQGVQGAIYTSVYREAIPPVYIGGYTTRVHREASTPST